MNTKQELVRNAEAAVRRALDDVGSFSIGPPRKRIRKENYDVVLRAAAPGFDALVVIEAKMRITPQTATTVCGKMADLPDDAIPVAYAPVISPRVAEILEQNGVGFVDGAGNCRLRSVRHRVLIDRRGYKLPGRQKMGAADPFSKKSSRIVRVLLSHPADGWKVRQLAEHPDIQVSVGLVSKVKRTLLEENYAVELRGRLCLRDPLGLLENWSRKYPGPAEQVPMYFRGDAHAAEEAICNWCRDNDVGHALAGLSAAWRLAPEVRHNVAAVYVDSPALDREMFDRLNASQGVKRAETGANLLLWRPFDRSVLAGSKKIGSLELPVTSAIQTYLDLKQMAGRGEEAAASVYEKHLAQPLREAARRARGDAK